MFFFGQVGTLGGLFFWGNSIPPVPVTGLGDLIIGALGGFLFGGVICM